VKKPEEPLKGAPSLVQTAEDKVNVKDHKKNGS
jgi:hypothetical protein